jgi:hypothetical protein
MDERFRRKGIWIGLAALALVFLCVMLVGLAAVATLAPHLGPGSVAVPEQGNGYVPIRGYWGPLGFIGWGIGLIFKLLFLGLLLLLVVRLVRHLLWGPRHWGYRGWGPPWMGRPPEGKEGEGTPGAGRGPGTWHRHAGHWPGHWGPPPWWGAPPEEGFGPSEAGGAGSSEAAGAGSGEAGGAGSGYSGPQE